MPKVKKAIRKQDPFISESTLTGRNFIIFGIGILTIIIGYFIMASGDTYSFRALTLAPIILLIGYLIIVPAAILLRKKNPTEKSSEK
ncbi:MAG: DUF3098 domain-containing protein [Fidelibacterota bacterium]